MKLAKFDITFEALRDALGLPDDCEILGIAQAGEFQWERRAVLLVTDPSLPVPEHREGGAIIKICPSWGRMRKWTRFIDWGLESVDICFT